MRSDFTWSKPEPIGQPAVKPFPVDVPPPVIADMIQADSEFAQVPADAPGVASLCMLSVSLQQKFEVENRAGFREPLNLYTAYAAQSGERKSGSYRPIIAPGYEWERLDNERRAPDIRRFRDETELIESEIVSIRKSKLSRPEKSQKIEELKAEQDSLKSAKQLQLFADDVTQEAFATLIFENDERGAIFSSEGGVLGNAGRYSDVPYYDGLLKYYSGDPVRINRRGRVEIMNHPLATIFCCLQPLLLEEWMKNEAYRGRGVLARFLFVFPESKLGTRRYESAPIPPEVSRAYRNLIFDLLNIPLPDKPHIIVLSDEAHEAHKHFFDVVEGEMTGKLEHIADFAARLPGNVLRIAGLLHVASDYQSACVNPISGDTMKNAVKLGWYFLSHALKTFAYTGVDEQANAAQYAVKRLMKAPALTLSKSEIHALCRGRFEKVESLRPVLKNLISLGYLREVPADRPATTGRRPEPRYELNPLYFKEVKHDV